MESAVKTEREPSPPVVGDTPLSQTATEPAPSAKGKNKNRDREANSAVKRRCVSTACKACRRRKSKCDGALPRCAACASVYLTECEYAPHTDHRRKGVYNKNIDSLKTKNSTLQTLVQAILNYDEEDAIELVRQIRRCENLEDLAESIIAKEKGLADRQETPDSPVYGAGGAYEVPKFEAELSGKMGDLMIDGSVKFVGGTSNLIWLPPEAEFAGSSPPSTISHDIVRPKEEAILSWTRATDDKELILHLMNMYFCWHYPFFTTLSKELFYRDFLQGRSTQHCSALLVNVMLCLGCHFTLWPGARADPNDSATAGDHFFKEAKRIMYENDEFSCAKLCTVQALALMSVREAGCGREGRGWLYSGMSFRMACDLGLSIDAPAISEDSSLGDEEIDARRITFWGCFLFDKCWSNYLGRMPMLVLSNVSIRKPDVFPSEESELWSAYTDSGIVKTNAQPARTRAVALQISKLAEISSDVLTSFYHHSRLEKPVGKQAELKKLSDLHTRLEAWKRELPPEMEPKDSQLPQVLLMHMFFQLLFIHLYRPFLKYNQTTSPLPSHISSRKFCTQAAGAISKLLRLYKRTYGLQQICNVAVYIAHSACTIHLLNLPDKNAKRDIVHGLKHLEEIGDCWTCARRTIRMLNVLATKWKFELPEEAAATFARAAANWGTSEPEMSPTTGIPGVQESPQPISVAQQAPAPQDLSAQPKSRPTDQPAFTHLQDGLLPTMAPSPTSIPSEPRHLSDGYSASSQSAPDLNRGSRHRPSTNLTQAQQDAWNARQAAWTGSSRTPGISTTAPNANTTPNASILFGGVDSLVAESQDWWSRDQSALALGFDNWDDSINEWMALGLGNGTSGNSSSMNETAASDTRMTENTGAVLDYESSRGNSYDEFDLGHMQMQGGGKGDARVAVSHGQAYGMDGYDDDMYY